MMPSGDYEMMRQAREREIEYKNSQIAFTSELVDAIGNLSKRNLELESEVSDLREKLQKIHDDEVRKTFEDAYHGKGEIQTLIENYGKDGACTCRKCNPKILGFVFIVCPTCGNKRCPHASDHGYICTNSNATGQEGSVYQ